jgi:glycosyltransferase involved in cell wall biosynthesis
MSMVIMGDSFTFPEGQAATNRVATYAKGLIENGITVNVIVMMCVYKEQHTGENDGIPYFHAFEHKQRSPNFFVRRWRIFKKYVHTYQLLRRLNRQEKIVAINVWTTLFQTHMFCWLMARVLGTKLIRECSEHPLREHQGGFMNRKIGVIKTKLEARFCDGILCISRYLVNFFKELGVKEEKLFLLPSTVDPSRFAIQCEKPLKERYIGYFGSLTFYRDSIDVLIRAFGRFSPRHPEVKLVLGGFFSSDEQEKKTRNLIAELNITPQVVILDYLDRQEVLKYILHADVLVLARSKDLESNASYPSKLTEYLSTGIPVVSVKVGEIPEFLEDNVNSYLVEPGDDAAMADRLEQIFSDYPRAIQIGKKGKELTSGVFNYNVQARRMIGFINSLYKTQPQWRPLNSP